jgi:nucleotidyltransferase substrate binding protein (TIGR01987 family)
MDTKLKKQYNQLKKAVLTFEEVLEKPKTKIVRDASIQRFEYSVEILWKVLKSYIEEYEGIVCNSPKKCIRSAFKVGLIDEEGAEKLLEMIDDRNETVHTYIEAVAEKLFKKLPGYLKFIKKVIEIISENLRK